MPIKKEHLQLHQLSPQWKFLGLLGIGIGIFNLIGTIAWLGPDPMDVMRSSSSQVPDFSRLSEEDVMRKLQDIVIDHQADYRTTLIEFADDKHLHIKRESADSSYKETRMVSLAELDQFVYAEKSLKGKLPWRVNVFCANYQMCIKGSNSRTKDFTLNQDTLILEYQGGIETVLGLLNRLLEIHGAERTIDQSKNTIRISQEYWDHP